jgi:hypothetical protein
MIAEAEILSQVYTHLRNYFQDQFKNYFYIMKFTAEMENNMLDTNFIPNLINDILNSKQYTLEGIACYTYSFEEVIADIVSGKNYEPTFLLGRKIIDLHRSVRPELYQQIIRKITTNNN